MRGEWVYCRHFVDRDPTLGVRGRYVLRCDRAPQVFEQPNQYNASELVLFTVRMPLLWTYTLDICDTPLEILI